VKVTVFGATGAIGRLVVDDLLQASHDAVAHLRNPGKVPPHLPTDHATSSSEASPTRPPSIMPSGAATR
jgi:uncharacterized protein YbjT (DUF2867 family)